MATSEERIESALDVLKDICEMPYEQLQEAKYYEKRAAAEEILRHYREERVFRKLLEDGITLHINGALPVRPMTRSEVK